MAQKVLTSHNYIDCSQIFKCKRELLESLLNLTHIDVISTEKLREYDKKTILYGILDCIMQVPPYLTIVEVNKDGSNKSYSQSFNYGENKRDEKSKFIANLQIDLDEEYIWQD